MAGQAEKKRAASNEARLQLLMIGSAVSCALHLVLALVLGSYDRWLSSLALLIAGGTVFYLRRLGAATYGPVPGHVVQMAQRAGNPVPTRGPLVSVGADLTIGVANLIGDSAILCWVPLVLRPILGRWMWYFLLTIPGLWAYSTYANLSTGPMGSMLSMLLGGIFGRGAGSAEQDALGAGDEAPGPKQKQKRKVIRA
ncbi:hypothetical protein H696_02600 [Fonticula alba]|uniref:Uncharacterized protein n=1 Tax=Fonticula alba TaxID=691883 RepID=A0A058Z7L2_FONAL|nr:hypothetical protein H696_02600 [Fonticula alba]KCV70270.1 hypothetical protein H696_02600 [Fonticula alba]|eukprot:XP_009494786.1 hypothetical protein H696_02600 [Fonticula alba]